MAKRVPTPQERLLSDAYRILFRLDQGDAELGIWGDVKEWLRSYRGTIVGAVPLTAAQEKTVREYLDRPRVCGLNDEEEA